jgi:phosphate/sulfate permease
VKYERRAQKVATDWEMKVLLVLAIVLLGAATAFAYGRADVAAGVSVVVAQTAHVAVSEPAALLISGGLLLVLASAVRRLPI